MTRVIRTRLFNLLNDWNEYRHLHSNKATFGSAIDIEIDKEAVAHWAAYSIAGMSDSGLSHSELKFRVDQFERYLNVFKDRLTIELIKNGN